MCFQTMQNEWLFPFSKVNGRCQSTMLCHKNLRILWSMFFAVNNKELNSLRNCLPYLQPTNILMRYFHSTKNMFCLNGFVPNRPKRFLLRYIPCSSFTAFHFLNSHMFEKVMDQVLFLMVWLYNLKWWHYTYIYTQLFIKKSSHPVVCLH